MNFKSSKSLLHTLKVKVLLADDRLSAPNYRLSWENSNNV